MIHFNALSRTTAIILVLGLAMMSCDQNTTPPQPAPVDNSQINNNDMFGDVGMFTRYAEINPTWAGSYLSSRIAQDRFDWSRAETFLDQVTQERVDNPTLQRRLMLLAMGSGDYNSALAAAKKLSTDHDDSGLTSMIIMLEPIRDGQFVTARAMLDRMPSSTLVQFAVPLLQAWLDASSGKDSLNLLGANKAYYFHKVLLADHLNRIDVVADRAQLLANHQLLTALSAERIGDIFLRHQKYDLANVLYKATELLNPNADNLTAKLDASANKTNPLPAGLKLAPPVANVKDGIALALFDMATSFYNERSFESAQLFSQMALVLKPDLYDAKLLVGNLLARNNRNQAAIDLYRTIPATSERYQAVQQQIANLLVHMKRDDQAIAALKDLVNTATEPRQKIDYLMQIGDIYSSHDNFTDGVNHYNQAIALLGNKIDTEDWNLFYARGMSLERLKRFDEAERDLQQALKFRPDHPYLLNYLGYSWADRGINLEQALEYLQKASQLVPNDGAVVDSLGWTYYRMKKYTDAVIYLERAVELMPYDPTVNDHLGDAYWQVGRKREANFQWQRAYNYSDDETLKTAITAKIARGSIDGLAAAESEPIR